jgi:ABC-type amino acid transport system permease subunit
MAWATFLAAIWATFLATIWATFLATIWATFWASFSQTHPVTLHLMSTGERDRRGYLQHRLLEADSTNLLSHL